MLTRRMFSAVRRGATFLRVTSRRRFRGDLIDNEYRPISKLSWEARRGITNIALHKLKSRRYTLARRRDVVEFASKRECVSGAAGERW